MGEGEGAQTLLPSAYIPILTVLRMGPVIAVGGTRNLINGDPQKIPNGTLICQKGPIFPRWDPIWPRGLMFTGTCLLPPFPALKGLSWVGRRLCVQMAIRDSRAVSRSCCKRFGELAGKAAKGLLI